jgi:hypothetical protein
VSPVSRVTQNDATINGIIDSMGLQTTYEIDLAVRGGVFLPITHGSLDGGELERVGFSVTGLTPGATYSYRLLASNEDGTAIAEGTFVTNSAPQPSMFQPQIFPVLKSIASENEIEATAKNKTPDKHHHKKSKHKHHKHRLERFVGPHRSLIARVRSIWRQAQTRRGR